MAERALSNRHNRFEVDGEKDHKIVKMKWFNPSHKLWKQVVIEY